MAARDRVRQWTFVIFMLLLTGLFVMLGTWQVQRLTEKEAQIATVAARTGAAPIVFPPVNQWTSTDEEALEYRPVSITGNFDHGSTVLVFDNLTNARGIYGGIGYWVMTPMATEDGGIVWINRGFVPEHLAAGFARGGAAPEGTVTVNGLARRPERANAFTPGPDIAARRDWLRDPARLAAFLPGDTRPVAPVTVDLVAGEVGELPQGGETQLTFSNRHLEYAGTWFVFALITPIMLGFWLFRQRRTANLAERPGGD